MSSSPQLKSVSTGVGVLKLMRKYLIEGPALEVHTIKYLYSNINQDNVLFVLQDIKILYSNGTNDEILNLKITNLIQVKSCNPN